MSSLFSFSCSLTWSSILSFFFFNDTATTEIYTLSLHDALPIWALANNPSIVLMDEPFGALDAQTREVMQEELSRIQRVEHKTIVFVTHSIREAVYLADRLVVLTSAPGRIKEMFTIKLGEARRSEEHTSE